MVAEALTAAKFSVAPAPPPHAAGLYVIECAGGGVAAPGAAAGAADGQPYG